MDHLLSSVYTKPEHPGSFGGVNAIYNSVKGKVKKSDVKKWLETKDSYTLHKPVRHKFKRNRVIVGGIDEQFQIDLVDMQSLAKFNNGFKYLLTCIDCFSKYAWAIPIKDKSAKNVLPALKTIFRERKPEKLQSDKGTEFTNKLIQQYLKNLGVHFFTTNNETKSSIVERFNRTLKMKMWKYFTEYNTKKYIDVISKLIDSYNHTKHRSIKMEPASVNIDNQKEVWNNLYSDKVNNDKPVFQIGDTVRISKSKRHFEKGYENNWTRELFVIDKIIPRNPIVYKLKDLMNESIEGTFYAEELQKVVDSGFYPVEKIIKKKKINGKMQYFVKFLGYSDKFNDWVTDVHKV
ncbi:putative uncharacterized transposon-derived protein F54H12.3 isoform X1 [Parasteatoda tepidariorum]|uniref:putative uncharacterized transposon-derived protein F54H12.3 isoform X1 n=1 Tax=Parasteatoda tepidariorum TaxID=114398 RepID=UPI0039BC3A4A